MDATQALDGDRSSRLRRPLAQLLAYWQQTFGAHEPIRLYRPVGCDTCKQTGYKGRIGLHELLMGLTDLKMVCSVCIKQVMA